MARKKEHEYPWYKIVDPETRIGQGDFFYGLHVIKPTSKLADLDLSELQPGQTIEQYGAIIPINCIVMTHACDFQVDTPDDYPILVCPIIEISTKEGDGTYVAKDKWESLARGRQTEKYLLNNFVTDENGLSFPYHFVDLKTIYSIEYGLLKHRAKQQGKRVRLLPPYREHMAQAFARRFMRIGLPDDLPRKRPW